jgi:acyl carrier protein
MHLDQVKAIVIDVLSLSGPSAAALDADTPLLGNLPELDSMAVVSLLTALEEHFGITIDDDEMSASIFETLGSLARFVTYKTTA